MSATALSLFVRLLHRMCVVCSRVAHLQQARTRADAHACKRVCPHVHAHTHGRTRTQVHASASALAQFCADADAYL
eukprot:336816-Pleurochrysis_carterae.AAC.1